MENSFQHSCRALCVSGNALWANQRSQSWNVLGDMLNKFIFVYLDNILIFSCSETEHITHVRVVLQRVLQNHLFV